MHTDLKSKSNVQLIWGMALTVIGVAVFFRTSQIIPRLQEMNYAPTTLVFIRICFYLMGIILAGGGIRKIVLYLSPSPSSSSQPDADVGTDGTDR